MTHVERPEQKTLFDAEIISVVVHAEQDGEVYVCVHTDATPQIPVSSSCGPVVSSEKCAQWELQPQFHLVCFIPPYLELHLFQLSDKRFEIFDEHNNDTQCT